ncbi:hypothetical protein N4P33_15690 [Streptomyces sp. 15-116A]|uniref:hypothetical protein n=1 Tax=Streptomyces sp. 15-116A TaxID=2259035 RepID=UPI0021B4BCC7|nr:hypothetical protein [Streptomyces sp. 15-116A]MCT7353604.1 hypothetical protein [Streptomyces sp. 15-116A]
MAFTSKDPHNLGELARVVALGARIQRRKARGKGTKRLENRVEKIREQALAREAAEKAARENARKKK